MKFISSDTNIWLDFDAIARLDLPFRMPCTYIMYNEALRKEIITPSTLLGDLKRLGLLGVSLTTEEFFYASDLARKYVKLSGYDRTALAIAKFRQIPLLTGDNALRKAAKKEQVEVMGTIGLLDRLYEGSYISESEYQDSLHALLQHPERRLPKDEIENRLHCHQRNDSMFFCEDRFLHCQK